MNRTLFDVFNFPFGMPGIIIIIIFILGMGTLLPMILIYFLADHHSQPVVPILEKAEPKIQEYIPTQTQPFAQQTYYLKPIQNM